MDHVGIDTVSCRMVVFHAEAITFMVTVWTGKQILEMGQYSSKLNCNFPKFGEFPSSTFPYLIQALCLGEDRIITYQFYPLIVHLLRHFQGLEAVWERCLVNVTILSTLH